MSGWTVLIVILVMLPVGLLSVPLTFKARGCLRAEERRLELGLSWGWGLLAADTEINGKKTAFRLRLAGMALPVHRKKPGDARVAKAARKVRKKAGRKKRHGLNLTAISAVLSRQLLLAALGYLKRLFKSFRLQLRLSGVYGADDPALTGLLAGVLAALQAGQYNLDLDADFSGAVIDIAGEASGRIVPIVIIWLTIRFLLAEPARRFWWAQLKKKFIRKKSKEVPQYV